MTVRINARLDSELTRKLAHLQARTGKSTTELIRASIESYFERVTGAAGPRALLDEFVGCSSSDLELSETYKSVLHDSLARKLLVPERVKHGAEEVARRPPKGRRRGTH
jgi:hypothetical protein